MNRGVAVCLSVVIVVLSACSSGRTINDCGRLSGYSFSDPLSGGFIALEERNYPVAAAPRNMQDKGDYGQLKIGERVCIRGRANEHGRLTEFTVERPPDGP